MLKYIIQPLLTLYEQIKESCKDPENDLPCLIAYILLMLTALMLIGYSLFTEPCASASKDQFYQTYNAPPVRIELADSLLIAQPVLKKFSDPKGCALSLLVTEAVLGIKPETQLGIMSLETASTYSHKTNAKSSSAKGLYQFLDATSKELSSELKLPNLATEWRQLRAGRLLFEKRQTMCQKRYPKYNIGYDKIEAYLAILYPSAPCTCNDKDVILRGRAALVNPAFHIDNDNRITYRWEIGYKLNHSFTRSEVNFN